MSPLSPDHGWNLTHSYAELPDVFYRSQQPTPVGGAEVILFNHDLAEALGLRSLATDVEAQAEWLSGNQLPPGARPLAQAYAGHQFGNFTMLGDGRAILLGEQLTPDGALFDIQLKGAGTTPFSRRGDGRATLYSMLREYLISEAMHHLGIPTSRSLAVVASAEAVYRRIANRGAILTRVMSSHLRVGTFEYAKRFAGKEELQTLVAYALNRHFPELAQAERPALALLSAVMERQVDLVVNWMRVGFIHGVMNTDNVSIAGETFDYGPCAFMNAYAPATVFSSIDVQGRYAFGRQPGIAHWNLAVLAGALLPIVGANEEEGLEEVRAVLDAFSDRFTDRWFRMFFDKLGLIDATERDRPLVEELLQLMEKHGADYTNTFLALRRESMPPGPLGEDPAFVACFGRWQNRLSEQTDRKAALALAARNNPVRIPRNHLVEAALEDAVAGDLSSLQQLLTELSTPYVDDGIDPVTQLEPAGFSENYQTFCGT